jgi:cytochrome c
MNNFEFNKIFAAVLLALLTAWIASFIGHKLVHPEKLEKNAYVVEGVAPSGGAETAAAPADKGPAPIAALLVSASIDAGQKYSRACAACHSFEKGGPNKVGPNLYGIVGNKHAHMDGFAYSSVIKDMHDKAWDYEELNHFLYNPRTYAPGTKMAFAGIKNDQDRANVIAWLRTLADAPVPLPAK